MADYDHCTEQNFPVPKEPVLFSKFASAISGDGDPLPLDETETAELDFEVELVIVVGKRGRKIAKEDALEYIAGWTVAHDVSARDWQLKKNGGQWLLGKTPDGYAPIGPSIVTRDEGPAFRDAGALAVKCMLNGQTVQNSNTRELIFKPAVRHRRPQLATPRASADLPPHSAYCHSRISCDVAVPPCCCCGCWQDVIAFASRFVTLAPGDLILTGMPSLGQMRALGKCVP